MSKKKTRRVIDFNTPILDVEGKPIPFGGEKGGNLILGEVCSRALRLSGQKNQDGSGEKIGRDDAKKRYKLARQICKPKNKTKDQRFAILSLLPAVCEMIQDCIDELWGTEVQVPSCELLDGVPADEIWGDEPESVDRTKEVDPDAEEEIEDDEDEEEESETESADNAGAE